MKFSIIFLALILVVTSSCSKTDLNEDVMLESTSTALVVSDVNIDIELEIFDLVNGYRAENGLSELSYNNQAQSYTLDHNLYMISKDEISHDDFAQRSSELSVEVNATRVSENVGRSFSTAEGVFKAWLASASHLKNIEGDYTQTAISVSTSEDGTLYFTQVFIK
ncbi:CAP domain-containing protein [Maribacter forsetii]|uniref:CAP domain-containing protein n=1 Tax=Maribacter forsetii TaxID=444515 RepID=UPI000560DDAD|nr:CAP domain-containing protein [Maribacter forsetii]